MKKHPEKKSTIKASEAKEQKPQKKTSSAKLEVKSPGGKDGTKSPAKSSASEATPKDKPRTETASKPAKISAEDLGRLQREISISEFFTKNRHLLGFDNASRALLTAVKEAVDNSLDACEEVGTLPDIKIRLEEINETRFKMTVEDNGPGIVKQQIPNVFGKLLYGSKFHRLRQSRGQQGIGISAAGMYGQLTTGKPVVVTSKTGAKKPAHHYHLVIDTAANKPVIKHEGVETSPAWAAKETGTSVSIEMEAVYKGGKRSVDEYVQQVAFANPHARIEYFPPGKAPTVYPRVSPVMPEPTKEIKPHPYGVELGVLMRLMEQSASRTVSSFLQSEFSRVSSTVAEEICKHARVDPALPLKGARGTAEALYKGISQTKIMSPPTNCLAPIGETALLEGMKALLIQQHLATAEAKARRKADEQDRAQTPSDKAIQAKETKLIEKAEAQVKKALDAVEATPANAEDDDEDEGDDEKKTDEKGGKAKSSAAAVDKAHDTDDDASALRRALIIKSFGHPAFITAVTRPPKVYRGNPFQVEAALAYGGELELEELASVYRFANRVPLLYQQGACAMTQAAMRTNWKSYDVMQSAGALPTGPLLIMVHIASVWVPFTSEAKEAVAHYDEIITELKYALQECGRRLSRYIRRRRRFADLEKKQKYIEQYIPAIGEALQEILSLSDRDRDQTITKLTTMLERSRKM